MPKLTWVKQKRYIHITLLKMTVQLCPKNTHLETWFLISQIPAMSNFSFSKWEFEIHVVSINHDTQNLPKLLSCWVMGTESGTFLVRLALEFVSIKPCLLSRELCKDFCRVTTLGLIMWTGFFTIGVLTLVCGSSITPMGTAKTISS